MAWILKEKEIEALLTADGKRRYEYFIHRVCETRKIWGLHDQGWASLADGDTKLLPLWPHATYARKFKTRDWSKYEPAEIDLDDFLGLWVPRLKTDNIQPAIFPVGIGNAVIVTVDDLEADLRQELGDY